MTNELAGFASLPADTFAEGSASGGDDGEGNPIDANGRTAPLLLILILENCKTSIPRLFLLESKK